MNVIESAHENILSGINAVLENCIKVHAGGGTVRCALFDIFAAGHGRELVVRIIFTRIDKFVVCRCDLRSNVKNHISATACSFAGHWPGLHAMMYPNAEFGSSAT